jgi:hypothetical protein
MLKLLMKKLGTPDSDPPSVEGSGGVSAEGATALALVFVFAVVLVFADMGVAAALPWPWGAAVRGWGRCVRTSGAGTVVVPGLVAVSVVVVVVVEVGVQVGLGGAGCDGASTVVVGGVGGVEPSEVVMTVVVSASAPLAGIRKASAASGGSSVVVSGRRIISFSCRAGS